MNIAILVLGGLILIIIVAGAIMIVLNQEAQRKKRMMSVIRGAEYQTKAATSDQDLQNKRRSDLAKKLKEGGDDAAQEKPKQTIALSLGQAGLDISVMRFWGMSALSCIVFTIGAMVMGQSIFVTLMAAVIGLFGFPRYVLKRMAAKRQKKFLEEFPDALEATIRLLKAGMPVSEAIHMIAREYEGPVGEEMTRIYDQQKIGVALHEAAQAATKRMPLAEMKMFATGLSIQAQTGSSLSEILHNLANVIRSRFKLKRKIKALSSEAVASASIIGALPVLLTGGFYFTNKEYISLLFTDPFGNFLLACAIGSMCVGIVVMRMMINFKI